ncbi:diguanylate cyclase domain-containing protein [Solimonas flava]|uniref:diguanylate cyclase domain-containing protein n=1 Tax=Solimonas flava TaxID=415849 RepID=UPI0003FF2DA5|nr:diguanylate cyclase [Solimonas flava]
MSVAIAERPLILIVDDTPANLRLLSEALADDYDIMVATSGASALALIDDETLPDAILLDIMMPGMDGYEVCRRLKARAQTQDIPVLFVTAEGSESAEARGLELGAVDYITKPFSLPIVRARLRTQVQLRRRTRLLEQLALMDGLTGVGNRRGFEAALQREWQRAQRTQAPLSLLLFDVDDFKSYNDRYGHGVGDAVLRRVARVAAQLAQRPGDFVGRFGGDEFLILLPDTAGDGAQALATELEARVASTAQAVRCDGVSLPVSVSAGSACRIPAAGEMPDLLVEAADAALYARKRARKLGGGRAGAVRV